MLQAAIEFFEQTPGGLGGDLQRLRELRSLLDDVVETYPASNEALDILLQYSVQGLDIAALDARLEQGVDQPAPQPDESVPLAQVAPDTPPPAVATEPADAPTAPVAEPLVAGPPSPPARPVADAEPAFADPPGPASETQDVQGGSRPVAPSQGAVQPALGTIEAGTDPALSALLAQMQSLYDAALDAEATLRPLRMQAVREVIDRIIAEHPSSNEAVALLLGMPVGSVDPSRVLLLSSVPASAAGPGAAPPEAGLAPVLVALDSCYSRSLQGYSTVPSDAHVVVIARFNDSAELAGIPEVVEPEQQDSATRRLFLVALEALDGCAAGRTEGFSGVAGQQLRIGFGAREITELARATAGSDQSRPALATADAQRLPLTLGSESRAPASVDLTPFPVATERDENGLQLTRTNIREIQGRLTAMGFDTGSVDGAAGRRTRAAVSAWQESVGIPASGFLDERQLDSLRETSEAAYRPWLERNPSSAPEAGPRGRYLDGRGCLREGDGRFVRYFRPDCR